MKNVNYFLLYFYQFWSKLDNLKRLVDANHKENNHLNSLKTLRIRNRVERSLL